MDVVVMLVMGSSGVGLEVGSQVDTPPQLEVQPEAGGMEDGTRLVSLCVERTWVRRVPVDVGGIVFPREEMVGFVAGGEGKHILLVEEAQPVLGAVAAAQVVVAVNDVVVVGDAATQQDAADVQTLAQRKQAVESGEAVDHARTDGGRL